MANIPGATNALPGVFTDVITQSSGVAIPGGSRVVAMVGQGSTNSTIVSQALGGGKDGLNPSYTSNSGSDGRHFALPSFPVISNRTTIFKNGIPLVGLELGPITSTTTFSNSYDYQLDITTGHILLQGAQLKDQGGTYYVPLTTNVGLGTVNALTLLDQDAPPETWTIRCVGVTRNAMNQPIGGTASFIAIGSVSGSLVDANGNPFVWVANNQTVSNGILSFSIAETQVGSMFVSPFVQGDAFTVIVSSGVLVRGDSVTSVEIPVNNINNPTLCQGLGDIVNLAGFPSYDTNQLSLGGQLLFSNGASSMIALQAAPPLPRRTSYILEPTPPGVNAASLNPEDFIFPFPLGVVPDINSDIHVFQTNPTTLVETQVLPNKYPFYTLNTMGQPTTDQFVFSDIQPPAGFSYSYTVIQSFETVATGYDGYIGRNPVFTNITNFHSSMIFTLANQGQLLEIVDEVNVANNGTFLITAVANGALTIRTILSGDLDQPGFPLVPAYTTPFGFPDFTSSSTVTFELIYIPTGLPVAGGSATDGTLAAFLNTSTATLMSPTVAPLLMSLGAPLVMADYRLKITASGPLPAPTGNQSPLGNNGVYDIIAYDGVETLTLQMAFVTESNLRYEIVDPSNVSTYLVLNHNVILQNNQLRVTIVDARDAAFYDAGWINALAVLETVDCDILVTLPNQTISVIFQNAVTHCITQSNIQNRHERVLFLGAIQGLTPANLTGVKLASVEDLGIIEGVPDNDITSTLAQNIQDIANYSVPDAFGDTYRAVYFYPDQIAVTASGNNVVIDGFYIAAAAAGFANADLGLENPFTNKVFSGFTIMNTKMFSTLVLEQLAAAGVTTLQPVAGGGRVVWGITTTQSGFPEEQEISIVFIRDRVAKILRSGFGGFIGTPQTANTATALNTEAVILLNSLISQGLITAYTGLAVQQDAVDPRQWDISVSISPTFPINWIYIKVTVGNLTG